MMGKILAKNRIKEFLGFENFSTMNKSAILHGRSMVVKPVGNEAINILTSILSIQLLDHAAFSFIIKREIY